MGWVVYATSRPLYPRERPGTLCIGGWVGPRAGLHGCGKSCPHRDSSPARSEGRRNKIGKVKMGNKIGDETRPGHTFRGTVLENL
jgi:hypothetical protein